VAVEDGARERGLGHHVVDREVTVRTIAQQATLCHMKPVTVTTKIDRSPEDVYELLGDLSNHEAFTDHFLVDWDLTREDSRGAGAGVRLKTTIGPHRDSEITVIESTPRRIVEDGRGGKDMKSRTRGTYTLEPAPGGGTEVTFTLEMEPGTLTERLGTPVARAYLRKQNARAMERLRGLMEGAGERQPRH
jgi:uncharacterized protein YndB with AHSA1/START domain